MAVTEEKVRECLMTVLDPELGVDIVRLGLVYEVRVKPGDEAKGKRVEIVMTLTTPGCPLAGVFDPMVRESLRVIPELDVENEVAIELTFDPPWTIEMMDEETREELGFGER